MGVVIRRQLVHFAARLTRQVDEGEWMGSFNPDYLTKVFKPSVQKPFAVLRSKPICLHEELAIKAWILPSGVPGILQFRARQDSVSIQQKGGIRIWLCLRR